MIRNGDPDQTYPGCINLSFAYVEGESLLMALKDIALSSGRYANVFIYRLSQTIHTFEGFVAQWCNPLTLQPEQSGGVGSILSRTSPLERNDNGSRTRLGPFYSAIPAFGAEKRNFTFSKCLWPILKTKLSFNQRLTLL